jgi:hypothetical protein
MLGEGPDGIGCGDHAIDAAVVLVSARAQPGSGSQAVVMFCITYTTLYYIKYIYIIYYTIIYIYNKIICDLCGNIFCLGLYLHVVHTRTQYMHAYSRRFARSCESVNPAMMACTVRVHDINPCWTLSRSSDWVSHITLEIQSYIHIILWTNGQW